jgi:polyphenol oxidase
VTAGAAPAAAAAGGRPAAPRDLGTAGGYRVWGLGAGETGGPELRFVGRDVTRPDLPAHRPPAAEVLRSVGGGAAPHRVAGLRQVHSQRVVEARHGGVCGDGDALITGRAGIALSVVTADCVPVLIAAGDWIAAVHAGWRGLVGGVIGAAVDRLRAAGAGEPSSWRAWIGPAIGECCYEVGPEVAERVAAASSPRVVVPVAGANPRLDLVAAAAHQLAAAGVPHAWLLRCTRCDDASLWSYRRHGEAAGRNLSFIWRP